MATVILICFFGLIAFLVALLFGAWVRWHYGNAWLTLLVAPIVSVPVLWIALYGMIVWSLVMNPGARNMYPAVIQALGGTYFYLPALTIVGIVPAFVGCLLGQVICKRTAHT